MKSTSPEPPGPGLGFQGPAGYQGQQGPYTGQQPAYAAGFPPGAQAAMYAGGAAAEEGVMYIRSEEEKANLYKLLKSDYNQEFVDFGEPPQNFVREVDAGVRFANYPRWARLIGAAEAVHRARVHPPQSIRADLRQLDLTALTMGGALLFDIILIDPPWREYVARTPGMEATQENCWSLEDLKQLPIPAIAENPSFIFIWAGDTHLDDARELLSCWGYRRCEDITWLKTVPHMVERPGASLDSALNGRIQGSCNNDYDLLDKLKRVADWHKRETREQVPIVLGYNEGYPEPGASNGDCVLQRVKEHCLMGLRGAVKRSQDHHIVHTNIDTDVIVGDTPVGYDEMEQLINTRKPAELYDIIERFALGRRKLELFGTTRNIRPGWLTVGRNVERTEFDHATYASWFIDYNPTDNLDSSNKEAEKYLAQNATLNSNAISKPGTGLDAASLREEFPLTNLNAYPFIKDFRGGKYEGSNPLLETLRPKSPPQRPTKWD
ncbi:SAM-binding domain protein [Gregarina niphandrodes]|uniref:SAM-binding domain protein n=1 Tax=Gregarina niphandrodes TaxID=110365 RepID=A0A023AX94_GRENI|nr:SAM-binding domain protein [Gregarina niphandrodes]EZG43329.1 SAM-binding domain protein [Gregarina niphandrodes]|eukprot:XP_011133415.1 SAM-binding domain protein [Gregarina niphandrodes]